MSSQEELKTRFAELRKIEDPNPDELEEMHELRRQIRANVIAKQRDDKIAVLFPKGPDDKSVLFVNHVCGHRVSYKSQALLDIVDIKLGTWEDMPCYFCEIHSKGVVLEGCWKP